MTDTMTVGLAVMSIVAVIATYPYRLALFRKLFRRSAPSVRATDNLSLPLKNEEPWVVRADGHILRGDEARDHFRFREASANNRAAQSQSQCLWCRDDPPDTEIGAHHAADCPLYRSPYRGQEANYWATRLREKLNRAEIPVQRSIPIPKQQRQKPSEERGEKTCITCGRIHPRNVTTSHHPNDCQCGKPSMHAPDGRNQGQGGCIWTERFQRAETPVQRETEQAESIERFDEAWDKLKKTCETAQRSRMCNMRWSNTTVYLADTDFLKCRFFRCKLIDDGPFSMDKCYLDDCSIQPAKETSP